MHRFFISKSCFNNELVNITGKTAHQIINVLRLKSGDYITILDNSGSEYEVIIQSISSNTVRGTVIEKKPGTGEPETSLTLYQALLKIDRFEFVLQKGVELGVSDFVPFISERCIAKKPSESRIERWQNIIREAAEQSKRACLPILHPVVSFREACAHIKQPALIPWEEEKSQSLAANLKTPPFRNTQAIGIFIGPEGGFAHSEIELAREKGIVSVGMGKRILRAETAGLAAISAVMYENGEFN